MVISNYNGRRDLRNCLTSIMSSDYPSFEMIVVDNVSSDGSIELIQELAHKDKRIRLVSTGRKVGVGAAWNIGINKCKGNYVALLQNDT